MSKAQPGLRIDKWLWQARFFKTRSLAAKLIQSGKLRLNGNLISKPSRNVSTGDVLTFPKMLEKKVIEVRDLGIRRGPAPEAQMLYRDLAPPQPKAVYSGISKGDYKPTAQERRALKKFKQDLESN